MLKNRKGGAQESSTLLYSVGNQIYFENIKIKVKKNWFLTSIYILTRFTTKVNFFLTWFLDTNKLSAWFSTLFIT